MNTLKLLDELEAKASQGLSWVSMQRRLRMKQIAADHLRPLVEVVGARCDHHDLPLEYEPQGDAHLPLEGWYHPVQMQPNRHNKSGIVYAKCHLTDDERAALAALHTDLEAALKEVRE